MTAPAGRIVSSATVAPNIIRYLMLVAAEHGRSLERTLRAVGLAPETVDAPTLRVSFRQGRALIETALDDLDVPALGILVGSRQPITASGLLGLGMLASPRIVDAVHLGVRFQNLAGSMVRWSAVREGPLLAVVAEPTGDAPRVDAFLVDEGFSNITRMARDATGPQFHPYRVQFARPEPPESAAYDDFFGAPVAFDAPRNAWMLARDEWDVVIPTADPWTLATVTALLDTEAESAVDRQELVAVLSARVEAALPDILPLAAHARELAMSERTLRRRLADVDTTYSDIVDEVRRRLTARQIHRRDVPVADIAARLGYSDERSMRRAVRRWFGRSPAELRRVTMP